MKLFSKIISAVAALSMVATMAVMPVAHAAAPVLKLTATPSDTYVDLTVSYTGADAKMSNSGIKVYIGEGFAPAECPEDYEGSYWDAMLDGEMEGWSTAKTGLDGVTFAVQATQIVFATATSKTTAKATLDASCDNLFTVRLYPTKKYDPTADYQFEFTGQNTLSSYKDYQDTLVLDVTDAKIAGSGSAVTTYAVTADATVTVDKTEAEAGEPVTVTPVIPEGQQVKEVKYNNTVITPVEGAYTFTMPEGDVVVTATFEDIPPVTYAVTADATVTVDKTTAAAGETVTVTPVIPEGQQVKEVKYNNTVITPVEGAYTFTMPAEAVTVTATFEPIPDTTPVATFETDEVTDNSAVGFIATLKSFSNFESVTKAGFVFANVADVRGKENAADVDEADAKELKAANVVAAEKGLEVGKAMAYQFKGLDDFDQFGLLAVPYIITNTGDYVWGDAFGSLLTIKH